MLRYLRPVGGSLAVISLTTLGTYFVTAVTSGKPQPWWPYVLLLGLTVLSAIMYLVGQRGARQQSSEPSTATTVTDRDLVPSETSGRQAKPVAQPASPVAIRLIPEVDAITNRLRLGVLNRGEFGHFRVEVVDAQNQDGAWVGRRRWIVPWLEDGSVTPKDIAKFGKPLLDFAHFDVLALQEDLDGTRRSQDERWTFSSLPEPVTLEYAAVSARQDRSEQYIVIALRVIRDEPTGQIDVRFKVGFDGTRPYCQELPEKLAVGTPMPTDPRQIRELAVNGRLSQPSEVESESVPIAEPSSAVTARWRYTSDSAQVPSLMRLTQNSLFHPGYMGRQPHDVPPSVKIGMLVACDPINPSSSGSELRAKFAAFLDSAPVRECIGALTHVPPDASWKNLAGHGPRTLAAVLTASEDPMESVPYASALFLPATTGENRYGRDGRFATLVLYVEPQTANGQVPPAADLATWHRRFGRSMALTGAFADFLDKDLELGTSDDLPTQFGIWLQSPQPLTGMVDVNGLRVLPAASPSNEFIGLTYADENGNSIAATARDLLTQLCEYSLHLDAFDEALAMIHE